MRILIVTPLYPPDIAPLALYVKEVAYRLSVSHKVTVLTYSAIPESVPEVRIIPIAKNMPSMFRMIHMTQALIREGKKTDYLYVQNGASLELPVCIASLFIRKKIVFYISDTTALARSRRSLLCTFVFQRLLTIAENVCTSIPHVFSSPQYLKTLVFQAPLRRPEILPFAPYPKEAFLLYEKSWEDHIAILESKCFHDTH